ncbi:MAG: RidA family protein [Gammaproteobacteria bacterium]|nr:RidA family protein [Gammaproteobacteria bacterium]
MNRAILPDGWVQPRGYSNGVISTGTSHIFVGGQIGWNSQAEFESDDFLEQVRVTLENVKAVLVAADAGPEHMVRMTWYVVSREDYANNLRPLGKIYREVMGQHYPPMSVVQVVALVEARAKVEIEVTACK